MKREWRSLHLEAYSLSELIEKIVANARSSCGAGCRGCGCTCSRLNEACGCHCNNY